jgi:hypothetical protein
MDKDRTSKKEGNYTFQRADEDLATNLHKLYDNVSTEPVPDYLMELLRKLPS